MAGGGNNRYPSRRLRGIMVNGIFMERHFSNWMFYRDRAPPACTCHLYLPSCVRSCESPFPLSLYVRTCFFFHVNFPTASLFAPSFFTSRPAISARPIHHRLPFFARPLKAIHILYSRSGCLRDPLFFIIPANFDGWRVYQAWCSLVRSTTC